MEWIITRFEPFDLFDLFEPLELFELFDPFEQNILS